MSRFRRELRYLVFKLKDIDRYLSDREREMLVSIENKIIAARDKERRPQLSTVVVERDWPEFEIVWGMIEARMLGVKNKYKVEIEELQTELNEQCRLLGMSAERELALQTQIQKLISERNALGLAIDRAISGIVPDEHPLRSRLVEIAAMRAQPAPSVPDGWIDPNDKTQTRYLPHIGEPVLFSHKGRVYYGKHTGGGFTAGAGVCAQHFVTWDCMWRPIPAAPGAQESNDV